ncbi:integral membrane protein TIGR01906 [Pilibacter termitis]|uniref:Integral membrane protein TIGR01906 n=1 Tax=Pilibacter termitis TaxID=263852 RepID=A0A1T4NM90_9ENTE|nr:TIGR01906 family membrane protein [Pilibacter termitis]SJZ80217.1 integral membrane protein TIGR01906 [Pilibacter termitis]
MKIENLKEFFGKFCVYMSIFLGSIVFVIHAKFLYLIILRTEKLQNIVPLSEKEIIKNYDALMDYMNNPFEKTLVMPNFPSSTQGLIHFAEVKNLFILATVLFVLAFLGAIWYLLKIRRENAWWKFIFSVKIAMLAPFVIGIFSALNFDVVFTLFHKILFRNDFWIYDATKDPIIKVLPENYFLLCFFVFFGLAEILLAGLFWKARKSIKGNSKNSA